VENSKLPILIFLVIGAIIMAAIIPTSFNMLKTASDESGPTSDTFTIPTVLPTLTTIPITPVRNLPVIANSQSVTIEGTAQTETTHYTFTDATGVASIKTDRIVSGDEVVITYKWETDSNISALYAVVGIMLLVVIIFVFLKMKDRAKA
jgi:hypothetical protein